MNTVLTTLVSKVVEAAELRTVNLVLARNPNERRFMLSYADRFCLLFSSEVMRVLYKRDTGTSEPWFLYKLSAGAGTVWFGIVDQPVSLDFAPKHLWWPDRNGIYGRTSWPAREWGFRPSAEYDRFVGTFDPSKGTDARKTKTAWEHLLAEAV